MRRLYRGYCIDVVRLDDRIHYDVWRLKDGHTIVKGYQESSWKVREVVVDLKAKIDLELGALE